MATVTLKGKPIHTIGDLPKIGKKAPEFRLAKPDLSDVSLSDFKGKKKILNIVTSLDTSVCALSAKKFNETAARHPDTVILTISTDLPFAQDRFCKSEGLTNELTLSQFRKKDFGKAYGVEITDGPLAGLLTRSIVVLDENDRVIYTELVPEHGREPNYDGAEKALEEK